MFLIDFLFLQFIGYPNTGKSSIINSLKRKQSVGTASTPGFTKCLASVKLDSNIELIDSPGVILNENEKESRLVLRNSLKLEKKINSVAICKQIIKYCSPFYIANIYNIKKNELIENLKIFNKNDNIDLNNIENIENNENELIKSFLYTFGKKLNLMKIFILQYHF